MEEVYFDELFEYLERIRVRKVNDYIMQLAIAQNPHIENDRDRRELWDKLYSLAEGQDYEEVAPELDIAGLEALKGMAKENPRLKVK